MGLVDEYWCESHIHYKRFLARSLSSQPLSRSRSFAESALGS